MKQKLKTPENAQLVGKFIKSKKLFCERVKAFLQMKCPKKIDELNSGAITAVQLISSGTSDVFHQKIVYIERFFFYHKVI